MKRFFKQFVIAVVFLGLCAAVVLLAWNIFYTPTCSDHIKNGDETGVDCGGSCPACAIRSLAAPIVLRTVLLSDATGNTVDVGAQIKNPNAAWGAKQLDYTFNFYDAQNQPLPTSFRGTAFLLPGQTRWVMELAKFVPGNVARMEFVITPSSIIWANLKPYMEANDFTIQNAVLQKLAAPASGFAQLTGTITNKSDFDAKNFEIQAVVYDKDKKVIAIGKTTMQTLVPKQVRDFRVFWQRAFSGQDTSFETFVNVNLLQDSNFLQQYGY